MLSVKSDADGGAISMHLAVEAIGLDEKADLYYLSLEGEGNTQEPDSTALFSTIERLLSGWLFQVKNLEAQQVAYLPFDFSDEYLGCLKCKLISPGKVSISYGYTRERYGHSVIPSQSKDFKLSEESYIPTSGSAILESAVVINHIEGCIKSLMNGKGRR
ncbi:hypothetical protein I2I05_21010 [Hymenobacter sp. BT683]|uniref:Uncharacterized protein n=1 Tax=Hymenobacter jeongseonensis TaxID=2791027 RepID=A0ABS0IQ53_9BACT|nr:hypothetical protein [Hymenobacter jeongseonensis]MBF9239885.1 hypothetical protein [Hymenobacter jeongseonensis]